MTWALVVLNALTVSALVGCIIYIVGEHKIQMLAMLESLEKATSIAFAELQAAHEAASKERRALEDRMMAMTNQDQLSMFKAVEDDTPELEPIYMDEEHEAAVEGLSNNGAT